MTEANLGTDAGSVNFDARLTRAVFRRCLGRVNEITSYPGSVLARKKPPDMDAAADAVRALLDALGFDTDAPALATTARKTAEAFVEALTCGYETDAKEALGSGFPVSGVAPIVATDIPVLFMCPHHLMPARGFGRLAFVAANRAPGLSRINRVFDALSRRLVLQEDLTEQIATLFFEQMGSPSLVVEIEARHTCVALEAFAHRDTRFVTRAQRGDPGQIRELQQMLASTNPR